MHHASYLKFTIVHMTIVGSHVVDYVQQLQDVLGA